MKKLDEKTAEFIGKKIQELRDNGYFTDAMKSKYGGMDGKAILDEIVKNHCVPEERDSEK